MRGDDFVGVVGFVWMNVMSVECENACFKVEHALFCTNQPLLSRVCCTVPGFLDYGYVCFSCVLAVFQVFSKTHLHI